MKLIPSKILNPKSDAEKKIFSYLEQISFGPGDVALHSLNIGLHEYKRWGEADFVLITARGILLLEVKGGGVSCKNGKWKFTNRFGEANEKQEGPLEQAKSAFFSLESNYLKRNFGSELAGVPCGFAVVFTDIPNVAVEGVSSLPELPNEITAYARDCVGFNAFRAFLDRAYAHWAAVGPCRRPILVDVIARISGALRPNFERVPSLGNQLGQVSKDLLQFSEEQYSRIDTIFANKRILVSGGAGTGKTFIALACARYEASNESARILLVTRSGFLTAFLRTQGLPSNVTVVSIASLEALRNAHGPWDVLIVDEGQDLCDPVTLDLIGSCVSGGWRDGRWLWFGDPNRQVSPSFPFDLECYTRLKSFATICELRQNVRNAGQVVLAISDFCGADVGSPQGRADVGRVWIESANDEVDVRKSLSSALQSWLGGQGTAQRSDVVVLVGDNKDPMQLARMISNLGYRAEVLSERALGAAKRDCVLVADIEDFKGLERPLVCVVGLSGDQQEIMSKFYRGVTRANFQALIIAPPTTIGVIARAAADKNGTRGAMPDGM